jgi:hypothetical protein
MIKHLHLVMHFDGWVTVDSAAHVSRLLELLDHLTHVHTLTVDFIDDACIVDVVLQSILLPIVNRLRRVRRLALTSRGNGTMAFVAAHHDTVKQMATGFKVKNLLSLDCKSIHPRKDWFPLHATLNAHTNLRVLRLGLLFDADMQCVFSLIAKAGMTSLTTLDIMATPFAYVDMLMDPMINTSTLDTHVMDSLKELTRVCTHLEHFSLDSDGMGYEFLLDVWMFLQTVSTLSKLRSFISHAILFNESPRPETSHIQFHHLEHFIMRGETDFTMLHAGLASLSWPRLTHLQLPKEGWTASSVHDVLTHAPHLRTLAMAIGPYDIPFDIVGALASKTRPSLVHVNIELYTEGMLTIPRDMMSILRTACPYATIHIQTTTTCGMYYGDCVTFDGVYMDHGHEPCDLYYYESDY